MNSIVSQRRVRLYERDTAPSASPTVAARARSGSVDGRCRRSSVARTAYGVVPCDCSVPLPLPARSAELNDEPHGPCIWVARTIARMHAWIAGGSVGQVARLFRSELECGRGKCAGFCAAICPNLRFSNRIRRLFAPPGHSRTETHHEMRLRGGDQAGSRLNLCPTQVTLVFPCTKRYLYTRETRFSRRKTRFLSD